MLLRLWIQKVQSTMLWRTMMHIQKPKFLYLHSTFYIDVNTITRMSEFLSTIACVSFFVCTFCCYINIYFFLIVFIFILLYSFNTSFVIIGIPHLYHSQKYIFPITMWYPMYTFFCKTIIFVYYIKTIGIKHQQTML